MQNNRQTIFVGLKYLLLFGMWLFFSYLFILLLFLIDFNLWLNRLPSCKANRTTLNCDAISGIGGIILASLFLYFVARFLRSRHLHYERKHKLSNSEFKEKRKRVE